MLTDCEYLHYLYSMHSFASAFQSLSVALQSVYDAREAAAIAHRVLDDVTNTTRLQRITDKEQQLTQAQNEQLQNIQEQLLQGVPLQYALGYEWFMGRQFIVNNDVLIPRPETEELVQWILDDYKGLMPSIIDIGTGSGCIPISLKLALPASEVYAIDKSEAALAVAAKNMLKLGAFVRLISCDFLNELERSELPKTDVIVSNPPYIPNGERTTLHENVRDHEPGIALFVPDDDALLFYRHIAKYGARHLKEGGAIYCELHTDYATATQQLFLATGYESVELRTDMHGNPRMLRAKK